MPRPAASSPPALPIKTLLLASSSTKKQKMIQFILYLMSIFVFSIKYADGRVAGKVGYSNNYYSGKSYSGINDELIMVSIGMAIAIAVLISIALCYIVREKCRKHHSAQTINSELYYTKSVRGTTMRI